MVGAVGPDTHATFWPNGGSQCVCKETIGVISWRVLMVGYEATSHHGIDFVNNEIVGEGF